ncbi:NAD(P)-binding domain-containing protein [Pseudohalocynthiibacter aestuariivivens]|nr:pyrroline-5-carboxylate reductase dimerization domain-containing protein [Pseudohalocynthiibacter aestuariivivens]QIE45246.1 NAD(P)-binding domain-containing protein [Pseudohalocynthiibacter aestuariivivens]
MKLGIIGVGHLATSILKGLARSGWNPADICLSPRGHGPDLARRGGYALAKDNADLVRRCDLVLLAVRPMDAATTVDGLGWREGQVLMNACAGVSRAAIGAAAPAHIVRIMPITASELGASPTLVYPRTEAALPFLDALGSAIELDSEDQFEAATVSAAIYGWAQQLIIAGADWSAAQGLNPQTARELAARTFVAAGRMQAEQDAPMHDILASLCTPGGITAAGLDHLESNAVPEAWRSACDLVLGRLRGK